jgi:hypothetical protein
MTTTDSTGTTRDSRRTTRADRFVISVALVGGVFLTAFGLWALLAPRSFFDSVAEFEPYNRHFIHDIGAFQIGLGAVLLLAVLTRDVFVTALGGVGIGAAVHALSHMIDHDLGGNPESDIPLFVVVAVVLLAAAAMAWRHRSPRPSRGRSGDG